MKEITHSQTIFPSAEMQNPISLSPIKTLGRAFQASEKAAHLTSEKIAATAEDFQYTIGYKKHFCAIELQNAKRITQASEKKDFIPLRLLRLLGFSLSEEEISYELKRPPSHTEFVETNEAQALVKNKLADSYDVVCVIKGKGPLRGRSVAQLRWNGSHDTGSTQFSLMKEIGFYRYRTVATTFSTLFGKKVQYTSVPEDRIASQDWLLKKAMDGSSGTSERYSIGTHSALVLRTFEKHFRDQFVASDAMSLGQFRIFLALHDSGKSFAMERKLELDKSELKAEELKNCREIIRTVGRQLKWSEKTIELSEALLAADTIGNYCRDKITLEEAVEELKEIAPESMDVAEFARLMILFHKSDAGSYKQVRHFGGTFTVAPGTAALEYSPNRQRMIADLLAALDSQKLD